MSFTLHIILAVFCVQVIMACDSPIDEKEMQAIQDRLALMEGIEKMFLALIAPEQSREEKEKCLPVGAGCSFASGPNCCGLRTRCIIFDHDTSEGGAAMKNAKWHSVCREYNGGVLVDEFKKLGEKLLDIFH